MKRFLIALTMLVPALALGATQTVVLDAPSTVQPNTQFDVMVWNNTQGDSVTGAQVVISFDDEVLTYISTTLGQDLSSPWQIQYVNDNYPYIEGSSNDHSVSFQVYGGATAWYQGNKRIAKVRFQTAGCGLSLNLTIYKAQPPSGSGTEFVTYQLETHAVFNGKLTATDDAVATSSCGGGGRGELEKPGAAESATWQRVKSLYREN